jgi:hypothetical protein
MKNRLQYGFLRDEAGDGVDAGGGAGTPPAEGTPSSNGTLGFYGEQGLDRTRLDSLPEEAKGFRSLLEKYPSESELYKGIQNLQYSAAQKRLERPPEDAPDDVKAQHQQMVRDYNRVPASPEEYGIKRPDDVPEEYWSNERASSIASILHQHNAPPELVQALVAAEAESLKGMVAGQEEARMAQKSEALSALRQEFGVAADSMLLDAKRGAMTLGINVPDDILDTSIDGKTFIAAMSRMTKLISEDRLVTPTGGAGAVESTGDIMGEIRAIKSDSSNPYYADYNSGVPERQQRATERLQKLYARHELLNKR